MGNRQKLSFEELLIHAKAVVDEFNREKGTADFSPSRVRQTLDELIKLLEYRASEGIDGTFGNYLRSHIDNFVRREADEEGFSLILKRYNSVLKMTKKAASILSSSADTKRLITVRESLEKVPGFLSAFGESFKVGPSHEGFLFVTQEEEIELPAFVRQFNGYSKTRIVTRTSIGLNPQIESDLQIASQLRLLLTSLPVSLEEKIKETEQQILAVKKQITQREKEIRSSLTSDEKGELERRAKEAFERQADIRSNGLVTKRYEQIVAIRSSKRSLVGLNPGADIQLPFEIFPAGEWNSEGVRNRLSFHGIDSKSIHVSRLDSIVSKFKPDRVAVGKRNSKGYEGYIIFIFEESGKVIAENPLYGNATYLVRGTWEEILNVLQLSKMKVRRLPNSRFVIHRSDGQWLCELEKRFSRWY